MRIGDSAERCYFSSMRPDPIRIVAALVVEDGRVLLVRKAGTRAFMQPGGKLEPGEGGAPALQRELSEELGCGFDAASARRVGRFEAPAANEPGRIVSAEIWSVALNGRPRPLAEIEELAWVDPTDPGDLTLAPLTRDFVLPLVAS